jgi:hypothetical protein
LWDFWVGECWCEIFGEEEEGWSIGWVNEIEGFEGCGIRVKKKKKKKVEEFSSQKIDSWDSKNVGLGLKKKNNRVLENWVGRRRVRDLENGELGLRTRVGDLGSGGGALRWLKKEIWD